MPVTHKKTDNIANWAQSDLNTRIAAGQYPSGTTLNDIVLPSDWNDLHTVTISPADMTASGTADATTFLRGDNTWSNTLVNTSAQAFTVGQNGQTNPAFTVDTSTASSVTGIAVKSAITGGGVSITATSSAAAESLTINCKGAGNVLSSSVWVVNGPFTAQRFNVTSSSMPTNGIYLPAANTLGVTANATQVATFSTSAVTIVGPTAGSPALTVDTSTASSVTGITVKSAISGGGVAITTTSTATAESLNINSKGNANILSSSPWVLSNVLTAQRINVTSSTVTSNGFYLPSANTIGVAANITPVATWAVGVYTLINAKVALAPSTTTYPSINIPAGTAPTTPVDGDMWNDTTQKAQTYNQLGNVLYNRALLFSATATQTVTNTTTETTALPTGVGSKSIAAGSLSVGKTITLLGGGVFTTGVTPGNVTIRVKINGTTVATATISNLLGGSTNAAFQFNAMITVRTLGATGTAVINGNLNYETGLLQRGFAPLNNTGATFVVDTTAASAIDVTSQCASAVNTFSTTTATIEISG